MTTYCFTRDQLWDLLLGAIGMYREYLDVHEHGEAISRIDAANEVMEGLDAERDLHASGDGKLSMQLPDAEADALQLERRADAAEAALAEARQNMVEAQANCARAIGDLDAAQHRAEAAEAALAVANAEADQYEADAVAISLEAGAELDAVPVWAIRAMRQEFWPSYDAYLLEVQDAVDAWLATLPQPEVQP